MAVSSKFNFKRVTDGLMSKTLPAAAGGAAAVGINKVIPAGIKDKLNPKIISGGKLLIGALVPEFLRKQKWAEPAALGWVGAAAAELTVDFIPALDDKAAVEGIGEVADIEEDYLSDSMDGVEDDSPIEGAAGEDQEVDNPIL